MGKRIETQHRRDMKKEYNSLSVSDETWFWIQSDLKDLDYSVAYQVVAEQTYLNFVTKTVSTQITLPEKDFPSTSFDVK